MRGTQDYLVSREVAGRSTVEEKRALIDGLYAVLRRGRPDLDASRTTTCAASRSEIDLEHHDVVEIAPVSRIAGVLKANGDVNFQDLEAQTPKGSRPVAGLWMRPRLDS